MSVTFKERNALGLPQRACDHSSSSFALQGEKTIEGERPIERGARPDHTCVVDKEGISCEDRV